MIPLIVFHIGAECSADQDCLTASTESETLFVMRADRIRRMIDRISNGIHGREEVLRLALLAAIAGENVFLYGNPGLAKSMIARRIATAFKDAQLFEYLLSGFTTPDELFGPVSIRALREDDTLRRNTAGFLPEADIAFLDEIWNASSAILNTLLNAVGERRFRNGTSLSQIPLRTSIASAANLPPEDAGLAQLWDRFLIRIPVESIADRESFMALINATAPETGGESGDDALSREEIADWEEAIRTVQVPNEIQGLIYDIRERIARHNSMSDRNDPAAGVFVSDRRWKHAVHLLRTSAYLNKREAVSALDTVLLRHILWSREEQRESVDTIIREALRNYSRSGTFDPGPYRERSSVLAESIRVAGLTVESVEMPVEHRGEYYRIVDFVEDHLSLIWIGDYQALSEEDTRDTDLFFYGEDEDYAYSERFAIRRIDATTLEVDGEAFPIETNTIERERAEPTEIETSRRAALVEEIHALTIDIERTIVEIDRYRAAGDQEAVDHLFVHRRYAEIVFEGMDEAVVELTRIKLELDESLEALRS